MKTIAFVDDDQNILDGLRRALRNYRKEWDLKFFVSGEELLVAFAEQQIDIVISDMRMPIMNGAKLLAKVRDISPGTLRITLSGYANAELIMESLHATHQFISKPTDENTIVKAIERGLRLQESLNDSSLKSILGGVESLPSLPEIYDELMCEISSETSSIEQVGRIIERDMALSSTLLKLVNSAFFALVRHIESPAQAAAILGVDTIKNIALSSSVFHSYKGSTRDLQYIGKLNRHCQQIGLLASLLAKQCEMNQRDKDHVQMSGMMVNLGDFLEIVFRDVLTQRDEDAPAPEALAGYLLGIWAMPFPVVEGVRWHKQPALSNIDILSPVAVVHAAWAMLTIYTEQQEVDLESDIIDIDYLDSIVGRHVVNDWKNITENFLGGVTSDD